MNDNHNDNSSEFSHSILTSSSSYSKSKGKKRPFKHRQALPDSETFVNNLKEEDKRKHFPLSPAQEPSQPPFVGQLQMKHTGEPYHGLKNCWLYLDPIELGLNAYKIFEPAVVLPHSDMLILRNILRQQQQNVVMANHVRVPKFHTLQEPPASLDEILAFINRLEGRPPDYTNHASDDDEDDDDAESYESDWDDDPLSQIPSHWRELVKEGVKYLNARKMAGVSEWAKGIEEIPITAANLPNDT
ncbi:hypothetical protein HDU76_005380 [Blyttiomyces sp. JEL0837]|nr:hypothetical protein HDU76_005380 [Blyttiomyces sp. JEL0837]